MLSKTQRRASLLFVAVFATLTKTEEAGWPRNKFGEFAATTCQKCQLRGVDCGCHLGLDNPPIAALYDYWRKYMRWSEEIYASRRTEAINFVVADVTGGGFGNQMMQAVQALVVALRSERALVIHGIHTKDEAQSSGTEWHACLDQGFKFDSVLPLIDVKFIRAIGWPQPDTTRKIHLHDADGLEFLTCGNWQEALSGWRFAQVWALTEPHLAQLNPLEGPELEKAFGDKLYFWLSNFLWNEDHLRDELVQIASFPSGSVGKPTPLRHVFHDLQSSGKKLIGLHLRCGVRLTPFDHYDILHQFDAESDSGVDPGQAFCEGDTRSMAAVVPCVMSLLGGQAASEAIVLWATDNDEISESVRRELASIDGLELRQIVRAVPLVSDRAHGAETRADHPDTRMAELDVAFLSQAEAMVGTALSTFSFLIHARALLTPALVGHVRDGCAVAAAPEAGLVSSFSGGMHQWSSCLAPAGSAEGEGERQGGEGEECGWVDVELEREQRACVAALEVFRHGCVAKAAPCAAPDALQRWASRLEGHVDMVNYFELLWSREGWRDHALVRPNGLQCGSPEGLPFVGGGPERIATDPMRHAAARDTGRSGGGGRGRGGAVGAGGLSGDAGFDGFMVALCEVCARRGEACGCERGVRGGGLAELWAYTQQYREWALAAAALEEEGRGGEALAGVRWVVVETNGGIGNQLLMATQGLEVALRTGRALVLEDVETGVLYDFSSVIPLIDVSVPRRLGYGAEEAGAGRRTVTVATDHRDGRGGLQLLGCEDWGDALAEARFVRMQGLGDVHLPLLNPHEGPWLRERFGERLFFFLSRFLWTGSELQETKVAVTSTPAPRHWDGERTLGELIAELRGAGGGGGAGGRMLLGVHLRITGTAATEEEEAAAGEEGGEGELLRKKLQGGEPFVLFSHEALLEEGWEGGGLPPLARYCLGDKAALREVAPCIRGAVAQMREAAGGGEGEVVVLWGTDREDATREVRREVEAMAGVTVVRLAGAAGARLAEGMSTGELQRAARLPGLLDVLLLSEGDAFMGTAHSTFSFLVHARALVTPTYTGHTPGGCARAASSEGGLVSRGVRPESAEGGEAEQRCLAMYCTFIHGCLQEVLGCVGEEEMAAWAVPFLLEVNFVAFYQQLYARQGWRDLALVPHTGIECHEVLGAVAAAEPPPTEDAAAAAAAGEHGIHGEGGAAGVEGGAQTHAADRSGGGGAAGEGDGEGGSEEGGADAVLVVYCYMEAPRAKLNFEFFLEQALGEGPREGGPAVHYAIVLVDGECSVVLPQDRTDVTLLSAENQGSDLAAFGAALAAFGYTAEGARRGGEPECEGEGEACRAFSHFLFINSSCRGPFIPPYLRRTLHWTFPFTSLLRGKVKLVGPSMHFIPSYSTEAAFCNASKSALWGHVERTGAGPRVDGYMHAMDLEGLAVILREDIYREFPDKAAAVNLGEYGLSRAILEAGFSVDCLLSQLQGRDWSDPQQWPGPKGFVQAASINQVRTQWHDAPRVVYAPQPYEAVFVKTRWGESYTSDAVAALERVSEAEALGLARVQEDLYSAFERRP